MVRNPLFGLFLQFFFLSLLISCASEPRAPVDNRSESAAAPSASVSQAPTASNRNDLKRDYHVVEKGDTLYSIAWRYGHDYRNLAIWNNISATYVIYPGQFIRLKPEKKKASALQPGPIVSKRSESSESTATQKRPEPVAVKPAKTVSKAASTKKILWQWPTKGKLIKLNTPTSKKGLDIAGRAGQNIKAAARGEVVYSGSGLLGYGKLIIIKHNETYLSAYAHNDRVFAKEGELVKAGQKIATMGLGNKGRALLHFEIRKDGTPVNPLKHLPGKQS